MFTALLAIDLLCLLAAAVALRRLACPVHREDAGESFARVLAAAEPIARRLAAGGSATPRPRGGGGLAGEQRHAAAPPRAARATRAEDERLAHGLPFADRLALLRPMLQGVAADEAAAAFGLSPESVRALYRLYGRNGGETC